MGGVPEETSGVRFKKNVIDVAKFCLENGKEKLFTNLLASIPTGDVSVEKSEEGKKGKTDVNNKGKKRMASSYKKSTNKLNTRNGHKKHQAACKTDNRDKGNDIKTKRNVKNDPNSGLKQCALCTKRRVRINDHYLANHKLDYHKFVSHLTDKDSQSNDTTCPHCKDDYRNKPALYKHFIDYHNFKFQAKRRLRKKNARVHGVNEDTTAARERKTAERDPPAREERVITEKGQNGQEERENPHLKSKHSAVRGVEKLCDQCQKYIEVSSFDNHTASHERERQTYPYKTQKDSTQSEATRDNSNETLNKAGSSKQDGHGVNHGSVGRREARGNAHSDQCVKNEELPATSYTQVGTGTENPEETNSGLDDDNGSQDTSEDRNTISEANDEIRRKQAEIEKIEVYVRNYRKQLWKEFYEKMKMEHLEARSQTFDQFLTLYRPVAPQAAVCHKRMSRRQPGDARQPRVEVVAMALETSTACHSGVRFTKTFSYLKTAKYD